MAKLTDEIDALIAASSQRIAKGCVVKDAIASFEGEDRASIERLIRSKVSSPRVEQYLATKGVSVRDHRITGHRRSIGGKPGGCSCPADK